MGRISNLRTGIVRVLIVTPESPSLTLGNSITANRWAGILRALGHEVDISGTWNGEDCELLIALHARRSEPSIEQYRRAHPARPVILALTGTDLYRDLRLSDAGHRSLALATRIVGLQEAAKDELDAGAGAKLSIIYQSAIPPCVRKPLSGDYFDVCVLSHLRAVKDPLRAAWAARLLRSESRVRVTHAGRVLESEWEAKARAEEIANPRYRWVGELSHPAAMELLAASRLLVLSSMMEGGASAIAEAVVCGVPVLCSDIPGNVGMLGSGYPGYFRLSDTEQLAELLTRCEFDREFLAGLHGFIAQLRHRFAPEHELASWARLLADL
jgi:putative glycosyltransferase (TIGR04348 family)